MSLPVRIVFLSLILLSSGGWGTAFGQTATLTGRVLDGAKGVAYAAVGVPTQAIGAVADSSGRFTLSGIEPGSQKITISALGYQKLTRSLTLQPGQTATLTVRLTSQEKALEEVVVTGVSRSTKALQAPLPTSVLSRREISLQPNGNAVDAAVRGVAGVSAVTTGPNISKPFIRGLGYNRVLTLYDGIRQESQQWGDEHGIEVDPYGIGRIEVVKGPASLSYGSDALAGVVNFIPHLPRGADGVLVGDLTTEYQSNNGMAATSLGLGYRKQGWLLSARATGKAAHDYRNRADGYVYNTGYRESVYSLTLRRERPNGFSQISGNLYDNLQEIPDGSRDSLSRRFTRQVLDAGDDIRTRPLVSDADLRSYAIAPLHQHIQHRRLYTTHRLGLGGGHLNLSLAAQQSLRREYNHPTQPQQPGLYLALNTYTYHALYELPAIRGWELNLGINGMAQQNRHRNATDYPIPDYDLFDGGAFITAHTRQGNWEFTTGFRLDLRRLTWGAFYLKPDSLGFDRKASAHTPEARLAFAPFARTFQGYSGSMGGTYTLSEGLYLKANLGLGYRAPSVTELGAAGLDPGAHIVYQGDRSFSPEQSLQTDLGLATARPDYGYSLSVFANGLDGYIYLAKAVNPDGTPLVVVPGNATYRYRQSQAYLYGAEASGDFHPQNLPWFNLTAGIACTEGRLYDSPEAGRYLPFIPPLSARTELRLTHQQPWGRLAKPFVRLEVRTTARQGHFFATDNTETATPGYTLLGIGVGGSLCNQAGSERLQFSLQADNLLDAVYQSHLSRLKYFEYYSASPNGRSGIYNMGRNFSVKLTYTIGAN